jgi:hypothetical protein
MVLINGTQIYTDATDFKCKCITVYNLNPCLSVLSVISVGCKQGKNYRKFANYIPTYMPLHFLFGLRLSNTQSF